MKNTAVVDQSYWDNAYSHLAFAAVPADDTLRLWLLNNVVQVHDKSCIEIGCFPGRYITVLGELGYTLNGVDLTPRVAEMKGWLASKGFNTGTFDHADFLKMEVAQQYDLVCSFGFIEHFTNWRELIQKQSAMVKSGGTLVIETPNFRGWMQQFLHKSLDAENFERHYIDAMQPDEWKSILEGLGFEVKVSEYFGKFEFWTDSKNSGMAKRILAKALRTVYPLLRSAGQGSKALSPYAGIIAVKK